MLNNLLIWPSPDHQDHHPLYTATYQVVGGRYEDTTLYWSCVNSIPFPINKGSSSYSDAYKATSRESSCCVLVSPPKRASTALRCRYCLYLLPAKQAHLFCQTTTSLMRMACVCKGKRSKFFNPATTTGGPTFLDKNCFLRCLRLMSTANIEGQCGGVIRIT